MIHPCFFGYGSLVNRKTHAYDDARRARLHGWRRVWRQTTFAPRPILTVEPHAGASIDGLIAHVPGGDWQALDAREHAYDRVAVNGNVDHNDTRDLDVATYTVPDGKYERSEAPRPIYLSYLDVVVQGYLAEFGEAGVRQFFETTIGWEAPIKDDRCEPIYPRTQLLTPEESRLVDAELQRVRQAPVT